MKALIIASRGIVSNSIKIAAALALLYFLWGLAKFLFRAGNKGSYEEGRNIMIWGIIALFVIFAFWGLMNFVGVALNIPGYSSGNGPQDYSGCINPNTGEIDHSKGDCGTINP